MTNEFDILRQFSLGDHLSDIEKHRDIVDRFGLRCVSDGINIYLENPLELLDPELLRGAIPAAAQQHLSRLDIHWTLGSTNSYVLNLSSSSEFHGYVCLAEQQTAGRGRRGRHWVSPFGKNIYLSLGWLMPTDQPIEGLSLAVGTCVAKAIGSVSETKVNLKWPNDILLEGGKAAGILVELAGGSDAGRRLVIGVGINLALSREDAGLIDQPWSVVEKVSRNDLVAALITELATGLSTFSRTGFSSFRESWQALDAHAGLEVSILASDSVQTGISRGVNASGNLILETSEGRKIFNAGEVSLRVTAK
ncbi:MAG: BirA family biotin operon repressor/biotin-[acetyl-CoA-carboxylase] ligase [Candidatus Azotimanducaceae bacterium]|jgi:BirA family biotin operon repressor/biotin-[acetyl-CoA-carboxylase] ligase